MKNHEKLCRGILTVLLCAACLFAFAACDDEKAVPTYGTTLPTETVCYVTFDANGGTMQDGNATTELQLPAGTVLLFGEYVPTKEGFDFAGWKSGDTLFGATDVYPVIVDITFTAQWQAQEKANA